MSREKKPYEAGRLATVIPIVISAIALGISVFSLYAQGEAVDLQAEGLEAQRRELEDAQARWIADGDNLAVHMAISGSDSPAVSSVGGLIEDPMASPDQGSGPSLFLSAADYDSHERLYLRITVRNLGRGPGFLTGIDGGLRRSEPVDDDEISTKLGDLECTADSDADAVYLPCSFPLTIDAPGMVIVRADISGYLEQDFSCTGDGPGEINVAVRTQDDELGERHRLTVSNYRGCADPSFQDIDIGPYWPPTEVTSPPDSPPITLPPVPWSSTE